MTEPTHPDGEPEPGTGGDGELEPEHDTGGDQELEPDGDGDGDEELEPVPAGQPASPQTPEQMEKQQKSLERETERHVKRVADLVGDDFPFLIACELCHPIMPGFRLPMLPPEEVRDAVRFAIGDRKPRTLQKDPYSKTCDVCDGAGETDSGSEVMGQDALACIPCGGKGWLPVGPERRGMVIPPAPAPVAANGEPHTPAAPVEEPPEVAKLRQAGYVVIRTGAPA